MSGLPLEHDCLTRDSMLETELSQQPISNSVKEGDSYPTSFSILGFWLTWACTDVVNVVTVNCELIFAAAVPCAEDPPFFYNDP